MKIKLKYFGRIAEVLGKSEEEIEMTSPLKISKIREELIARYPKMKKESFKMAHNMNLVDEAEEIKEDAEIVILPPFAGG